MCDKRCYSNRTKMFAVKMVRVYPKPIDSFWSLELSITLLIVFSIILIASIVGIVLCSVKLKI